MTEPTTNESKLNEQQQAFCREYCVDFNGTQSAIRAGYSSNCADVTASRLLTQTKIQQELAKCLGERFQETDLSVNFVLQGIMLLYQQCVGLVPIKTENGKSTKYIYNARGAGKALELLGKYYKMYVDNINLGAQNSLASIMKELAEGKKKNAVQ